MKALKWLSDRMELLPVETQQRLKHEEEKIKMARENLELEKIKAQGI